MAANKWPSSQNLVSTRESKSPYPVTSARCEGELASSTTPISRLPGLCLSELRLECIDAQKDLPGSGTVNPMAQAEFQ